jgi:hypothetical protein
VVNRQPIPPDEFGALWLSIAPPTIRRLERPRTAIRYNQPSRVLRYLRRALLAGEGHEPELRRLPHPHQGWEASLL